MKRRRLHPRLGRIDVDLGIALDTHKLVESSRVRGKGAVEVASLH